MNLVKRTPDRWFPSSLDDFFNDDFFGSRSPSMVGSQVPAVNIQENEDSFEVEVAAPGKAKEDFNIQLENDVLTISSEEKKENQFTEDNGNFTREEFSYNSFKRSFGLPNTVDGEKIAATYKNGVLEISIPKREEAKQRKKRRIDVS